MSGKHMKSKDLVVRWERHKNMKKIEKKKKLRTIHESIQVFPPKFLSEDSKNLMPSVKNLFKILQSRVEWWLLDHFSPYRLRRFFICLPVLFVLLDFWTDPKSTSTTQAVIFVVNNSMKRPRSCSTSFEIFQKKNKKRKKAKMILKSMTRWFYFAQQQSNNTVKVKVRKKSFFPWIFSPSRFCKLRGSWIHLRFLVFFSFSEV